MAEIRVLDKHTAELIAAGEVVERPASVVKELLENAIDAGSTQVTVTIESGGIRLIEISDNGSGIEAKYIPTAFIRHATSKIRTEDDLTHIHTLGFRGEALASIASVARVEVLTRTADAECASVYHIEGGEEQPMEPGARGVGTTIRVRDLFYNTPARMKFLKKDSSEGTFVADIVAHVALSHPEVSFKFVREGKLQYVTPGDGQLRSAAYAVLGREFSRDLVEVDNQEGVYRVRGLITQPMLRLAVDAFVVLRRDPEGDADVFVHAIPPLRENRGLGLAHQKCADRQRRTGALLAVVQADDESLVPPQAAGLALSVACPLPTKTASLGFGGSPAERGFFRRKPTLCVSVTSGLTRLLLVLRAFTRHARKPPANRRTPPQQGRKGRSPGHRLHRHFRHGAAR